MYYKDLVEVVFNYFLHMPRGLTDDKFNEEIEYIMQDQRSKIKARQRQHELRVQEEARKQEANKRRR